MIYESSAIPRVPYNAVNQRETVKKKTGNHRSGSGSGRRKNFCFACGRDNPHGMHLRFAADETGKQFVCRFRLSQRYTGPPGHCHGGIIATILDDAMIKMNRLYDAPAATSRMIPVRANARTVTVFGPAPSRTISLSSIKPEERAFG